MKLGFSMEGEMLRALQKEYNFGTTLVDGHDVWGILVNQTWTGVVGDVYYDVRKRFFVLCE